MDEELPPKPKDDLASATREARLLNRIGRMRAEHETQINLLKEELRVVRGRMERQSRRPISRPIAKNQDNDAEAQQVIQGHWSRLLSHSRYAYDWRSYVLLRVVAATYRWRHSRSILRKAYIAASWRLVARSPLFDSEYYQRQYQADIPNGWAAARYYVEFGFTQGHAPSALAKRFGIPLTRKDADTCPLVTFILANRGGGGRRTFRRTPR